MRLWLALLLSGLITGAWAETVVTKKDDFAYGMQINVESEAAIYQLTLPDDVYRYSQTSDFSDIRVFNALGEPVPHTLRSDRTSEFQERDPVAVPVYPYSYATDGSINAGSTRVRISINDQGTIIDATTNTEVSKDSKVNAYLLDISQLKQLPSRLEFEWQHQPDTFVAEVQIDGSNDLAQWSTVVRKASLVSLLFDQRTFSRRSIAFPNRSYKYLKINWPTSFGDTVLTGVKAYFSPLRKSQPYQWVNPTARRTDDLNVFVYELEHKFPVSMAEVVLPEDNSVVDARLYSRNNDQQPWRLRHAGSFYRLTVDDAQLESEATNIAPTQDRYWRIEVTSDLAGLGTRLPQLKLGYLPHKLYFLARGQGPYVLAYGAHEVPHQRSEVNALLARLDDDNSDTFIGTAKPTRLEKLGGAARLQPPKPPFPWQKVVLWSVLIIGVVILGVLAWRLGKQMQVKQ